MTISPAPLIGLAIGDALGMPFETYAPDHPELLAWDGESYRASAYHELDPGQWTDDTQMSIALATSLVDHLSYDASLVSKAYLAWFQSGDCRGIGNSTRKAMQNLAAGNSYLVSGIPDATGNGTAMRAMPIGAFFQCLTPEFLRDIATRDASITHSSTDAFEGSTAVALSIEYLMRGAAPSHLAEYLITNLEGNLKQRLVSGISKPTGPVSPYVVDTLEAALYAFLHTDDYASAVRMAIKFGGDTDSVAAITGALAGTHYGMEGIPQAWQDELEGFAVLRALQDDLLR